MPWDYGPVDMALSVKQGCSRRSDGLRANTLPVSAGLQIKETREESKALR